MRSHVCAILMSMTVLAAGCAHFRSRTDQQVASDVQNKIHADTALADNAVTINANQGIVTLSGNVPSDAARTAAANDAAQVDGVKTVINNLVVLPQTALTGSATQLQGQTQAEAPTGANRQPTVTRTAAKPSPGTSWHRFGDDGSGSKNVSAGTNASPATVAASSPASASNATAGTTGAPPPAAVAPPPPQPILVPSGTQLSIRLTNELNSETANVGDVFRGSVSTPVVIGDTTAIPTTADVEGRVVDVKSAGRFAGQSDLVIELTRLTMNGRSYSLTTDRWSKAGSSRGKSTAAKVGGGAAVGAILGGIFGGGKGAAIGGAAGAGAGTGVAAAGKGQQIVLKPETLLNFQLQNSISVIPGAKSQSLSQAQP